MMKNLLITALTFTALATASMTPRTSDAGLLIGGFRSPVTGLGIFFTAGGLLSMVIAGGGTTCNTNDTFCYRFAPDARHTSAGISMAILGGILIVLDQPTQRANAELMETLKARYAFIDNSEALENLAIVIQKEIVSLKPQTEDTLQLISIPVDSILEALDAADLSGAEIDFVVSDLS